MGFDWPGLEDFLTGAIIAAVRSVASDVSHGTVCRAVVNDFYVQDMLVLWPTIDVFGDRQWQFDADGAADEWASRITAHAGSTGHRWPTVIDEFFDHVVASCRHATTALRAEESINPDFVAVAIAAERDLISRCLTPAQLATNFPHIHKRDSTIEQLSRLSTDKQVAHLVSALTSTPDEPALDAADCVRLLVRLGEPAAVAAAETIAAGSDPVYLLTQVIVNIGVMPARVISALTETVRDRSRHMTVREQVACALAQLGQLDVVCDAASDLDDGALCAAIAAPYLSESKNGPLDYGPLESALGSFPHLHDRLFARLSANRMYPIVGKDLITAMAGLSSPWPMVRRHAAIVVLSTHM